jgi:type IV pilus assembly protein PilW
MDTPQLARPRRTRGTSLVEVMVGVTIALLVVLAVYRVFAATEGLRHDTQGTGDAQQTGLFVLERLGFDIANAGNGIAASARTLASCPGTAGITDTLRPVAVLITDGGSHDRPDSVVIRYGVASGLATAVPFAATAPAGANFVVRAPEGIAPGDYVIATSRTGVCAATTVTSIATPAPGLLEIAHAALTTDFPDTSMLLNLGPVNRAQTIRYDVVGGVLRTTDLLNKDAPNPLASNIVNLKLQYGIDSDGDGRLDTWVAATDAGAVGSWTPATLLAAPVETLARVKAIRVGVIVRSEYFDRSNKTTFAWTMFECPAIDKSKCPGRMTGTIAAAADGSWRYRLYETTIPLRNLPAGRV